MSDCNHDCSSCSENCADRTRESMWEPANEFSRIGKVIAVVSGKGGVGKSLVTSLLAVLSERAGHRTAILDADITGPSIPRAFGLKEKVTGDERGFYPVETKMGTKVMSLNLLTENETDPVVWRGPILSGTVKQFWTDVIWEDVDYMFVDMPPGTGDVPLTVYQSLPIDGIVVVASPQELVGMIVEKAVNLASLMKIPVLGLVENMSYVVCPHCGEQLSVFGESDLEEYAAAEGIKVLGRLPIDPAFAKAADEGTVEYYEGEFPEHLTDIL